MNECPSCDDVFDDRRSMSIHHKLSHGESLSKKDSVCESCGSEFKYYPSTKDGIYCSDCSKEIPWDWIDNSEGENHPNWVNVDIQCSNCGEELNRNPSKTNNSDIHFCDYICMGEYRSNNWVGEDHPNWRGGETESYGSGGSNIREEARRRDDYECRVCGKQKDDIGYGPEVHHIKPVREFDNIEDAHYLDNVICLCKSCHVNAEYGNITRDELNQKI